MVVIQAYAGGLAGVRADNAEVRLSVGVDADVGDVLFVQYPDKSDDPAARDVWCEAVDTDWTSGRSISFRVKPDPAVRLSVSFMDRNGVAYTAWRELDGGIWQTVDIAFADIQPNPYFQPPCANTGAPIDVSQVTRLGFAPQSPQPGRLAISSFQVVD